MSSQLATSFRGGALSEYLAHYLLSNIGISVPVGRQDDHGYDFICTLGFPVEKKQLMRFGQSFLVQIKATKDEVIEFGGTTEKGEWKKHELDWLFGLDLPFMIGISDKKAEALHLYATSLMWLIRYKKSKMGKIRFILDKPIPSDGYVLAKDDEFKAEGSDGKTYEVYLDKPVITLSTELFEKKLALADARALLSRACQIELQNIAFNKLNVPTFGWLCDFTTNGPFSTAKTGRGYSWGEEGGSNVVDQLESTLPILCTLAGAYSDQKDEDALKKLVGLYELISKHHEIPDWINGHLRSALRLEEQKNEKK